MISNIFHSKKVHSCLFFVRKQAFFFLEKTSNKNKPGEKGEKRKQTGKNLQLSVIIV